MGIKFDELQNNVAYIQQCLDWLGKDSRYVLPASVIAESAVDYVLHGKGKIVQLQDALRELNRK